MTTKIHGTDNIQPNTISEQSFASTIRFGPRIFNIQVTNSSYQAINAPLSTTSNNNYIVVTGENFVNSTVSVGSVAGGNLKVAIQTQAISTSELRIRLPAMPSGLYSLFITNQDGKYTIATNALEYYSTDISWTTASQLPAQTLPVQLTATGGTITYTSNNIPSGLTLSSSGLLSGTPTSNGLSGLQFFTLQFTVTADNGTSTYPRTFTFKYVDDSGIIYNTSHQLLVNEYVEIDLASSNEITFSASALPSGLSIDSTGTKLIGTPTVLQNSANYTLQPKLVREGNTYNFPVKTLAITVAPIKFTTSSNLNTWDNVTTPTYNQQIDFSPEGVSATYSITNTSLNTITINSSAVVSGNIPDTISTGSFNYTVQATSSGINITRTFTQPIRAYDHWITVNNTKYYSSDSYPPAIRLTSAGSTNLITVPNDITINCKFWGASGGNGIPFPAPTGGTGIVYGKGGSGGYAGGEYTFNKDNRYYLLVGEGGWTNNSNTSGVVGGVPGGGNTGKTEAAAGAVGSGGGYTGLFDYGTHGTPFDIGTGFDITTASTYVFAIALQSDGKIVLGGPFTSYNGFTQSRLIRLNTDGSRDTGFIPSTVVDNTVDALAIQSDNTILVGGRFTGFITKYTTTGTRQSFTTGAGPNGNVYAIAVQSDGKTVFGGSFTVYNNVTQNRITRANTDGTRDTSFNIGNGFGNNTVLSIAIQSDGKIVVGGSFTSYNGTTQNRITRLNSDGSRDTSFNIGTGFNAGNVNVIVLQSDGKILVGGDAWTSYNGVAVNYVVRLNSDGTRDTSFNAGVFSNGVWTLAIQSDGKIIAGGDFRDYNGATVGNLIRLNSDGSRDTSFNIGTGFTNYKPGTTYVAATVRAVKIQSDGKIIVGGGFKYVNDFEQYRITRLNNLYADLNNFVVEPIPVLIAGAGGGAAPPAAETSITPNVYGGHGGGNTGETGQNVPAAARGGGGGSQTEGGAQGVPSPYSAPYDTYQLSAVPSPGIKYRGGYGGNLLTARYTGAGGGSGYYGGGGGSGGWYMGGSGGGGSNYVAPEVANSTSIGIHTATYTAPQNARNTLTAPNNTDEDYQSGVAIAANAFPTLNTRTGGPGLAVLRKPGSFPIIITPGPGGSTLAIGDSYQGGYYAGLISYNCNGVATHRLIVSPKAAGETTKQWKTTVTNSIGTSSVYDGWSNTNNMNTTEHPLAQWARAQSIDGYGDWYIPSYYELEILYYNLKPTTTENTIISSAYGNGGGCGTLGYGLNSYAVPARLTPRAYTASLPAQTTLEIFQTTQAFNAEVYWSSTQGWPQSGDVTVANTQNFGNGEQTLLLNTQKTKTYRARLIRREPL